MSWPIASLGDLCEINIGRTPARSQPAFWNDGVHPWVSIADMSRSERIADTKEHISDQAVKQSGIKKVSSGTVLLSFKLSVGKVSIAEIPLFTNEAIAALPIRKSSLLDSSYLFRALQYIDFDGAGNRAAMGRTLNTATLAQIGIPLPPPPEQRRIAATLDKADALRRKRARAIGLLDNAARSIFLEMFVSGEQKSWPVATVESLAINMRTGPFGSQLLHSEFVDEGIPVLGIDNAVSNEFRWVERRFITPRKYDGLRRYTVLPRDVLITIMGTCGRCAVVPDDIPIAINTKHLCCITLDTGKCLPEFLQAAFLQHPFVLRQLGVEAKGAVMPGLNMGIIKELSLPLPPIGIQAEFVRSVRRLGTQRSLGIEAQSSSHTLFSSLQSRAFSGQL